MIAQSRLQELLSYNPTSGEFLWLNPTSRRVSVGSAAGCRQENDHISIRLDRKLYQAHRLAWLYIHGNFPVNGLDHKDNNKHNNAIANLREATKAQNEHNVGPRKNNSSGYKGVALHKASGLFRATCGVEGKAKHLGYFKTAEEANIAYSNFAKQHQGEFYHG